MGTPVFWVDAFTDTAFRGNPAAICLLDAPADEAWMQSLAFELGLAETAFLVPRGAAEYNLRWFTPTVEIPLCGHATLASAHTLFETGRESGPVTFHTLSGPLTCTRVGRRIEMDFPAVVPEPVDPAPGLLEALGVTDPIAVLDNRKWFIVEVATPAEVEALTPDLPRLATIGSGGASVTARSDRDGVDIVSRVFGPGVGVDEDSVTGSVHCALTPYWAAKLGKSQLVAYQASARGGTLHCRLDGDRVFLAGTAVTVLRGEVHV
jgi:PhzF family phenazine biosynthesis protein